MPRGLSNVGNRTGFNSPGFSKIQNIPDYRYDGLYRLTAADYDLGGGSTLAEAFDYDGERSERKRDATGRADMDVRVRPATCPQRGSTKRPIEGLGNRVTYYDHRNSITTAYENNAANEFTTIGRTTVASDPRGW